MIRLDGLSLLQRDTVKRCDWLHAGIISSQSAFLLPRPVTRGYPFAPRPNRAHDGLGTEERMVKVAALTSGRDVPSSRFRVRQHIEPLNQWGINVREFVPSISKYAPIPYIPETVSPKYVLPMYAVWQSIKLITRLRGVTGSLDSDVVWLERQLLPGYLTLEPLLKSPLVFDVDDAIWLSRPFARSAVIKTAKKADVIAGNGYLANWFDPHAKDVRIVPTAIDTDRFRPRETAATGMRGKFVIGWTGTWANLEYLYAIEEVLGKFLRDHSDTELLILADRPPRFQQIPQEKVRFIPWRADREVAALQDMDVGLMPLPDTEWTRGKCSFKMLQYMATGIPVIASSVGMNAEVMVMDRLGLAAHAQQDWYSALDFFYENRDESVNFGTRGRAVAERYFSRSVIAMKLAQIFKEIA